MECGNTLNLKEHLNYSVESLLGDNRFTQQQAREYGYLRNNGVYIQRANEIQIGNTKYNGRYGNIQNSNDGYNFKGRGLLHLTFRNNYQNFTTRAREWEWIDNAIDFEVNPDLLFENGGYAIMSAAYFWRQNNCFVNANTDTRASVDSVTRIINRYTDSYQARWNQYERIRDDRIFDEDWL